MIDVNGVGYEVHVPLSTFCDVGDKGSDVLLHIHTRVREDSLLLFGFKTRLELSLFDLLIAISGVGPRLALSVLSGIEPAALVRAIRIGEVERLTSIPGVGKKTAPDRRRSRRRGVLLTRAPLGVNYGEPVLVVGVPY